MILDLSHSSKIAIAADDRERLLQERLDLIDTCIHAVDQNFFTIGKALAEIKYFQLYKADPVYKHWVDYVKHRITNKIHQSTISDYIAIVMMQIENKDYIGVEDLIDLGYKKARLLKSKYHLIKREKDPLKKKDRLDLFKKLYHQSFEEMRRVPYSIYERVFDVFSDTKDHPTKKEVDFGLFSLQYNPQHKNITIRSDYPRLVKTLFDRLREEEKLDETAFYQKLYELGIDQKRNITQMVQKQETDLHLLHSFLKQIPKTEIHLHAEATVSIDTIFALNQKYHIDPHIISKDDVHNRFQISNLSEMIDFFLFFQSCFKEEEDFDLLTHDVREYLVRNHIFYSEMFFSPTGFLKKGLEFNRILSIIEHTIDQIETEDSIQIKLIIDVSRTFGPENAMDNLNHVLAYQGKHIIGIGLGGTESKGPAKDYIDVFRKARENGLQVVAHAGEEVGPESIWASLLDLQASRIGHGTSAIQDEELMAYLKEHQIPLEVCPTSNIVTKKYVSKLSQHPIREFFNRGLLVTLNTDDPMIFGVELPDEYLNLYSHLGFSVPELMTLVRNNLFASFMSTSEKQNHWNRVKKEVIHISKEIWGNDPPNLW